MNLWVYDVPLLAALGVAAAVAHAKWLAPRRPDFHALAGIAVTVVFWLNAAAGALGATPWGGATATFHLGGWPGLFYVLAYPLWFRAATHVTFVLVGRRPSQGGWLWPFTLKDRTAAFRAPWDNEPR